MRVIYTDESLDSLSESLNFGMKVLGLSLEKVLLLQEELFDRADSLALNPQEGTD